MLPHSSLCVLTRKALLPSFAMGTGESRVIIHICRVH